MNLVKLIEDQLSGDVLDKLGSAVGADADSTSRAASAAVPGLLAGLANLGSSDDGVRKLTNVLSGLESSGLGNITQMLGGDAGALANKGTGMLGSLFGDGLVNSLASAVSRFSGLDAAMVKKFIALLAPLVLGKVAAQWKNQGGTPGALSSLLAEQKRYIPDATPAGFSLADIPGIAGAKDAVRVASQTTRRAAEDAAPSIASWLLPVAGILLVGFLLWQYMKPPAESGTTAQNTTTPREQVTAMKPMVPDMPKVPSLTEMTDDLNATYRTLGETFAGIKDSASAEAAAPKLEELSAKIDMLKKSIGQLPETGRAALQKVADAQLTTIKEQAQKTLTMPNLSEQIKMLITQIIRKLDEWHIIDATG